MRCSLAAAAILLCSSLASAQPGADAAAGEALFTGRTRLAKGGPACASCHSAARLGFPYGGSMGPDLTNENSKLGPTGLRYALQTLYFPAMNALFLHRTLTPAEQDSLAAFFVSIDQQPPARDAAGPLFLAGVIGLAVCVVWTALAGRGRVRSVRQALLQRAQGSSR